MVARLPLILGLAMCVASCVCPCSDPPPSSDADLTHILSSDATYYTTGPQQARPPDGTLPAGTRVELLEEAGSYSRVRTADGTTAYVAADSLKPIGE